MIAILDKGRLTAMFTPSDALASIRRVFSLWACHQSRIILCFRKILLLFKRVALWQGLSQASFGIHALYSELHSTTGRRQSSGYEVFLPPQAPFMSSSVAPAEPYHSPGCTDNLPVTSELTYTLQPTIGELKHTPAETDEGLNFKSETMTSIIVESPKPMHVIELPLEPDAPDGQYYEYKSPLKGPFFNIPSLPLPEKDYGPIRHITAAQMLRQRRQPLGDVAESLNGVHPYANKSLSKEMAKSGRIPQLTVSLEHDIIPSGWTIFLHPQGTRYFWNAKLRTITTADLYEKNVLHDATMIIRQIYNNLANLAPDLPQDLQLVLDTRVTTGKVEFAYYFATMQSRCLFWMAHKDLSPLSKLIGKTKSHSHLKFLMESEYWVHYHTFPHVQTLPQNLLKELKGLILVTAFDQNMNYLSTTDFSRDELDRYITLVDNIKSTSDSIIEEEVHSQGYSTFVAGSLMALFALHKFDNFHGQKNARWRRDHLLQPVPPIRQSYLYRLFSPILFYSPDTYLQSLNTIFVGETFFSEAWRAFIKELHDDWLALIIIATVILATNVAFLAIPSIDNGSMSQSRSPAQILSYLSILYSSSSILAGQILARYHHIKGWDNLDDRITENYETLTHFGRNGLAVMFSMPYALLSWGIICFLAAFLTMCFQITSAPTRFSIGASSILVGSLLLWCIARARASDVDRLPNTFIKSVSSAIRRCFTARPGTQPSNISEHSLA